MNDDIADDVNLILANVYGEGEEPVEEVIHVHHYPDAIVIIKEPGKSTSTNIPVVDSDPKNVKPASLFPAYLICATFIFLVLSSILFQLYIIVNPEIATITIIPKSQQISLSGTLQLGRFLTPITISQSQTVPSTGKGHQDARQGSGTLTFYNGSNTSQYVNAGAVFTGSDGIEVITDEDANIPAANPPVFGEASVTAHTNIESTKGNISAYDINTALSSDLTVKNLSSFTGGQDARDFQVVTKADIDNIATPLQAALSENIKGAMQGETKSNEALLLNPCPQLTATDHKAGDEATTLKVTVSISCSGIAYDTNILESKVTQLLMVQAKQKFGSGYSLLDTPQVNITAFDAKNMNVVLSFSTSVSLVYFLDTKMQQNIKKLTAGKSKQTALKLLSSLPGIESVSISWSDDMKLPKDTANIHLVLIYG